MPLVQLFLASEQGVSFLSYDTWMGQCGFEVLILLPTGFHCTVHCYGFASFILSCPFNQALASLANRSSTEIDWSSVDAFPFWVPYTIW